MKPSEWCVLALMLLNFGFSLASHSIMDDIVRAKLECNVLIFSSAERLSYGLILPSDAPYTVVKDLSAVTSSLLMQLRRRSRSNCSVIIGQLSDVANMTTFQTAVSSADQVTIYLFAESMSKISSEKIRKQPTIFVVGGTSTSSPKAIYLQCPMKGNQGLVNIWSPASGFVVPSNSMRCHSYLNGQHITVATVSSSSQWPPYQIYDKSGKAVGGSEIEVLRAASRHLNFTYELKYHPAYILNFPGGGWGGVVGMVKNQTALFGLGPFRMTTYAYQAIDFVHFEHVYGFSIFCPWPKPVVAITNLIKPFTRSVWIALAVTTILVTFFYFAWSWSPYFYNGHVDVYKAFMSSLIQTFRTSLNQNHLYHTTKNPASMSTMLLSWFIGDFFLKSFYTSLLLTYLLSISYEPAINSFEDIYAEGRALYLVAGTQALSALSLSSNPIEKALAKQAQDFNRILVPSGARQSYSQEKSILEQRGCYMNDKWNQYGIANQIVERWGYFPYRVSSEIAISFYGSYISQKHAPYNEELRSVSMYVPDSGILDHIVTKHIGAEYVSPAKAEDPPPAPLTYMHFLGAFIILVFLGVVSILIFLAELVNENRRKKR